MSGRLTDKRAFVTGAGQGIGRAIALAFAREGATVVATSRSVSKVIDLPGIDTRIEAAVVDVTDPAAVRPAFVAAGTVDVLVNCAGSVSPGTILETQHDQWRSILDLNVTSMFHTIQEALPGMLKRGSGSIINVASVISSISGVPRRVAYGASKAAVVGLTKNVAADVVSRGVRCNALCPGMIWSRALEDRIATARDPEAARRAFNARQPMGRLGRPEEVAAAAVWLAADESAFVTGTEIIVDGGQTL